MAGTLEQALYPRVERWMKRHFKCFKTMVNRGLKYGRCDVVGVRDIGGNLSGEIETICIEVKRGNEPFTKASGQTVGYKVYGDRVYLAEKRQRPFDRDEIAIASHLGIGLIQIRKNACTEVLSSPLNTPIARFNLLLLENMAVGKCQICGSYFETGVIGENRYANVTREKVKKAFEEEKGMMFWNCELDERKRRLGIQKLQEKKTFERRFVCSDCVWALFRELVPDGEESD